jgi:carboxyl-terminal processing protease
MAASFARRAWLFTDLVLDQHVEPPARQEMLLSATRAMLKAADVAPPEDLGRRVSKVTTEAEFAALLESLWPQAKGTEVLAEMGRAFSRGILQPVPGPTAFISQDQVKAIEQVTHNRYVGTGIQVRMHPGEKLVQILSVFPRSPARRAGLRANDLFEEVDGKSCKDQPLIKVIEMLRGEVGSPVTVVVRQPGTSEKRTIRIVRDVVPFDRLLGYRRLGEDSWQYRVDPDLPIAYVRAISLTSSAVHELRQIERRLRSDECRALVLDLRTCSEGDAHHAALVADALLDGGVLWRLRDRQHRVKEVKADPNCLFAGWPMVVLVHDTTRDIGPRLLAAALQDARRATIIGEPTRGDAHVRALVPLAGNQGAIQLATAIAQRAGKAPAEGVADVEPARGPSLSVQPDQRLGMTPKQMENIFRWQAEQERADGATTGAPPEDPQLARAIERLREALEKR